MSLISENPTTSLPPSRAALEQQLRTCPYWSVRQLICGADQSRLFLRGTVPSYYLKQVAESLAAKAVGLGCVECDIEVHSG